VRRQSGATELNLKTGNTGGVRR